MLLLGEKLKKLLNNLFHRVNAYYHNQIIITTDKMSRKVRFLLFVLCAVSILKIHVHSKSIPDDDDYLDALLKEFQDSQKEPFPKKEDNIIPLNAQPEYLQHDACNCTKFFSCDVSRKNNSQEDVASESGESEGADVDLINIRLNVPEGGCPHYLEICCEKIKEGVTPMPKAQKNPVCGKRNDQGVGFRIIGSSDSVAQFGEFPWMSAITEKKQPKYPGGKVLKAFVCGASLIHTRVVLTAAHCLRNKTATSLQVRVGEWDTQTTSELYPHEEIDVEKIILHPNFRIKRQLVNDIALLLLKKDVTLAPNVAPICLPNSNDKMYGKRCYATGWGKDEFGAHGVYQSILKRVDLPIVSKNECEERLRSTKLGNKFSLHESFVCAGGEPGKDTCKGDGGSPLACQIPGSPLYFQYGIVSWGIGCNSDIPAVYVNVNHFRNWIEETIADLGLNDDKYKFSDPR